MRFYLTTDIGYLWYNLIGCGTVLALGAALQAVLPGGAGVIASPGAGPPDVAPPAGRG